MASFLANPTILPPYISSEIALIKSLPNVNILSSTSSFLTIRIQTTPHRTLNATFTFPTGYPTAGVVASLDNTGVKGSLVVPPHLKKLLETQCADVLAKNPPSSTATLDAPGDKATSQVYLVAAHLSSFIGSNLFVPLWKELRNITSHLTSSNTDAFTATLKTNATTGRIAITLAEGDYKYNVSLRVDPLYPDVSPAQTDEDVVNRQALKMTVTSNLPEFLTNIVTGQANEVIRRCYDGVVPEAAVRLSNPVRVATNFTDVVQVTESMDVTSLKSMQRDVDTLKVVSQLKNVNNAKVVDGHRGKVFENTTKERQDARRNLKKLARSEMEADGETARLEEQKAREAAKVSQDGYVARMSEPQPCLSVTVMFLVDNFKNVRNEMCGVCHDKILNDDPTTYVKREKKAGESDEEKKSRRAWEKNHRDKMPVRVHCGHYYHTKCLDDYMTEPPFGRCCGVPGCDRPVYFTGYPDDKSILERNYSNRQARIREVEDAAMLF